MGEGNPNYKFSQFKTPMDKDYYPELDDSPFLNAEMHTRYQSMVGSLIYTNSVLFCYAFSTLIQGGAGRKVAVQCKW